MKSAARHAQTRQARNPAPHAAAQKKEAPAREGNLQDGRSSSRNLVDLRNVIDQSPLMSAQRKGIARAFGPAQQGSSRAVVQRLTQGHGSGGATVPVVQRHPDDNALVIFIKQQGAHAGAAYDLLCQQVEAGITQVRMLEFYSGPLENEANPQLAAAKQRIADTAEAVSGHIAALPEAASEARATAVGIAQATTPDMRHELLDPWSKEVLAAVKIVALSQAKAAAMLVKIKDEAVKMASIAMAENEIHMMRGLLKVADDSEAAAAEGDRVVVQLNGEDAVSSSIKEKAGLVVAVSDALNNATTGVGFGVVGALAAGNVFSLSTSASAVLGIIGGVLGLFFGAIGTFLGVKNTILAKRKKKALVDAKSKLSSGELEEIADYAIEQKGKKVKRNTAATVGGLIAITAGALGLVAVSVASFGTAAIVAGLVAALVGLGFLGFKIIRNWRKRKAERTAFADELIAQIQGGEEDAQQARQLVAGVGLDPTQVGQKGFRKQLIGKVGDYIASKRTRMAQGLIRSLISGKPSEIFDAELILGALGVDPEWVKAQINADKVNKAVSKVAGKLASW